MEDKIKETIEDFKQDHPHVSKTIAMKMFFHQLEACSEELSKPPHPPQDLRKIIKEIESELLTGGSTEGYAESLINSLREGIGQITKPTEDDKKPLSIVLSYNDGKYPFNRECLEIVDYGYCDNIYTVASNEIDKLITKGARPTEAEKMLDWIDGNLCSEKIYFDGDQMLLCDLHGYQEDQKYIESDNIRDLIKKAMEE